MRERVQAPSPALLATESRAFVELFAGWLSLPLLRRAPRGDGHAVLILPGFIASDVSTLLLRYFLSGQGFAAHGWQLGRNLGPRPGLEERLRERLGALRQSSGGKVSLVGWSLGGIYAREMARWAPDDVRQVITLGAPFAGNPAANHAWWLFELASGLRLSEMDKRGFIERRRPLAVPSTAFYSRSDGVTAWQCCVQPKGPGRENIEVESSHFGFGHNPLVLYALADRLAQPPDAWHPFEPQGMMRRLYRTPVQGAPRPSLRHGRASA